MHPLLSCANHNDVQVVIATELPLAWVGAQFLWSVTSTEGPIQSQAGSSSTSSAILEPPSLLCVSISSNGSCVSFSDLSASSYTRKNNRPMNAPKMNGNSSHFVANLRS
eukprot:3895165-Amphidinium_carterae.1